MSGTSENDNAAQADIWQDLAICAQAGDKIAYNKLLSQLCPFIKSVIMGGLANPDWAEDITQEVLISVHKSLHTYSPERPFRPWLNAIIHYRRTDFLRKHYSARDHKQTPLDNMVFLKEHVTKPAHAGELKDIEAALGALPEKQRKVFEMLKIQGYTAKEVAGKMGMSVTAVKVSAHRTLHKLRARLE